MHDTRETGSLGQARQALALSRFLEDGRLPIHNNFSERELRREAAGRRNLLPSWPVKQILVFAPVNWQKTLERQNTQQRLAANVFRQVALGEFDEHRPSK